jgi:hypothetical protein
MGVLLSCGGGSSISSPPGAGGTAALTVPSDPAPHWTQTFLPSDADFPNPDRGFYSSTTWDFLGEWDADGVQRAWSAGRRLLMARVQLDAWRDADLPPSLLALLSQRLDQVRAAGMKVTLLFNYDFSEAGQDATSERIRQHLRQLKPVLAANAAVIPFMRAGFIGAWGEWHSSASGNSCTGRPEAAACAAAEAHRLIVRDALLENVPETTQLAIRYPTDLMRWYSDPPAAAPAGSAQRQLPVGAERHRHLRGRVPARLCGCRDAVGGLWRRDLRERRAAPTFNLRRHPGGRRPLPLGVVER